MKDPRRVLVVVALLVASAALGYWLRVAARRQEGQPSPGPAVAGNAAAPEAVLSSSVIKHSEGGKPSWKILLDQVELAAGGTTVGAQGVREGIVYDAAGKPALRVTAQRVTGDTARRNFEMTGDVVLTSPRGFIITTQDVQWFDAEKRIHCPKPVVMKTKSLVFTAQTLDYLVNSDTVQCKDQVRGYSGNNRFSGNSLTYDLKTEVVDVTGGFQMVLNVQEGKKLMQELRNP